MIKVGYPRSMAFRYPRDADSPSRAQYQMPESGRRNGSGATSGGVRPSSAKSRESLEITLELIGSR